MLDFAQKLTVFSSFPELSRRDVSLGRVNFHYEKSVYDKKNVGYHLHPNGNGYVYAGLVPGEAVDAKGFVNIRDSSESELRRLIRASIDSLSSRADAASSPASAPRRTTEPPPVSESQWSGPNNQTLLLTCEDGWWYVFSGIHLEAAFETYEETEAYLREQGFRRSP